MTFCLQSLAKFYIKEGNQAGRLEQNLFYQKRANQSIIFLHGTQNLSHYSLLAGTEKYLSSCFDDTALFQSTFQINFAFERIFQQVHLPMPLASSVFLFKGFPKTRHHSSPTDPKTHYARKKSTFHRPVMRQPQCNRRSKKKKKTHTSILSRVLGSY